MISIEQWRASIGSFSHRKPKAKNSPVKTKSPFWLHQLFTCISPDTNFDVKVASTVCLILLIVSGSVEPHPGPAANTIAELEAKMEARFLELMQENSKLRKEIAELKDFKERTEKDSDRLEELERWLNETSTTCNDSGRDIDQRLRSHDIKAERQEIYSRRENILIHGIPEDKDEDIEKRVVDALNSSAEGDRDRLDGSDFQRIHRLGKNVAGKNRPVIARFTWFQNKLSTMKKKDDISSKNNIRLSNDLTNWQRSVLKKHYENSQDKAYFKGDQFFINGNKSDPEQYSLRSEFNRYNGPSDNRGAHRSRFDRQGDRHRPRGY